MKIITQIAWTLILLGAVSAVSAEGIQLGNKVMVSNGGAIEAFALKISLGKNLQGFIKGKECDACKTVKLIITPETKAYHKRKEVPLIKAKSRLGRYATVFFNKKSKKVTRIKW